MSGLQSAANIPELRKRVLFTLIMLAVYRMGVQIPTPGINGEALSAFFAQNAGTLFGMFNMFSGGALENFSIFALGIMPYISASIIMQLMTVVVPHLEALKKEGQAGSRKITQYTRYGTVVLSIIQGTFIATGLQGMTGPGGEARHFRPFSHRMQERCLACLICFLVVLWRIFPFLLWESCLTSVLLLSCNS